MALQAPRPKSSYTPVPPGTYMARCYQYIQIGTVQEEYMGAPKMFHKIRLSFELPTETKVFKEGEQAKPIAIHKEFTLSMGEKANLRKLIQGIIGVTLKDEEAYAFDTTQIVGMPCLISVVNKTSKAGNVRDEIASASPLMKGMTCPPQFNQTKILTYDNWSQEMFNNLPDFVKEKIMESEEYRNRFVSNLTDDDKRELSKIQNAAKSETSLDKAFAGDITPDDIPF